MSDRIASVEYLQFRSCPGANTPLLLYLPLLMIWMLCIVEASSTKATDARVSTDCMLHKNDKFFELVTKSRLNLVRYNRYISVLENMKIMWSLYKVQNVIDLPSFKKVN